MIYLNSQIIFTKYQLMFADTSSVLSTSSQGIEFHYKIFKDQLLKKSDNKL